MADHLLQLLLEYSVNTCLMWIIAKIDVGKHEESVVTATLSIQRTTVVAADLQYIDVHPF